MRLSLFDLVGTRCIAPNDADLVNYNIRNSIRNNEPVILDFSGVTQFASVFFNQAIGVLLKEVDKEYLRSMLNIENASDEITNTINLVIDNSSKYYKDIDYRNAVDKMWEDIDEWID